MGRYGGLLPERDLASKYVDSIHDCKTFQGGAGPIVRDRFVKEPIRKEGPRCPSVCSGAKTLIPYFFDRTDPIDVAKSNR